MAATGTETEKQPKPTKPPKQKRTWRRRLLWLAAGLVILLALAPLTLALPFVRNIVADKASVALGRKVTIEKSFAYWGHGIDLEGVTIASPEGFDGPLATIAKVHVDVDVIGFATGPGAAVVQIDQPHITLRRLGDRRNTEGLGGSPEAKQAGARSDAEPKAAEPADEKTLPRLQLVVHGGRVEAIGFGGNEPATLADLELAFEMGGRLGTRVVFDCLLKNAGIGGIDAPISARVEADALGHGPMKVTVPKLDLVRLGALVEGMTGVLLAGGQLSFTADGELQGDDRLAGTARLEGQSLDVVLPGKYRISLAKVDGKAEFKGADGTTAATLALTCERVAVREDRAPAAFGSNDPLAPGFDEPLIKLEAEAAFSEQEFQLTKADLTAGRTAHAQLMQPIALKFEPVLHGTGQVRLDVDLGLLARLESMVPSLGKIRGGVVAATARLNPKDTLDVSLGIGVDNLKLAVGEPGSAPLHEPRIVVRGRWRQLEGERSQLDLYDLKSNIASTTGTSAKTPFQVRMGPDGPRMSGPLGMTLDLGRLSQAAPQLLSLAPGERYAGTVTVSGTAVSEGEDAKLDAGLTTRGLRLPGGHGGGDIRARIVGLMNEDKIRFALSDLTGAGLGGGVEIIFVEDQKEMRLDQIHAGINLDLGGARGLLGHYMGLKPGGTIAGTVNLELDSSPAGDGLDFEGKTTVQNLVYQAEPTSAAMRQSQVELEYDIEYGRATKRLQADLLRLRLAGLLADLGDSSMTTSEGDTYVDARARLTGDAGQLAGTLRAFMGPGYADLEGSGAISGNLTVVGNPAEGGKDLSARGNVQLGNWTTSGLRTEGTQPTLARTQLTAPQQLTLETGVNGGQAKVELGVMPGPEAKPMTLRLNVEKLDTSTMLVDKGPGRYMAFLLPSLMPPEANVPVLSGLLTATADLRAADIAEPLLLNTLTGNAKISMTEGAIKDSTFFKAAGGKDAGKLGMLLKVVPVVGEVFKSMSRALAFSTLESEVNIGNRVVDVVRTALVGRYVVMHVKGKVNFDQRCDLVTHVRVEGSAGATVAKVLPDRTIPFRVKGTLSAPQTQPDIDTSKILGGQLSPDRIKEGIGDVIKGKNPLDKIKLPNPFK